MGAPAFDYDNGGLNPRPSGNKPGQLYYDYDTGQQYYMGYPGMNPNDPTNGLKLLGQMVRTGEKPIPQKIYVDGANKPQIQNIPQHTPINIAALFPQLSQAATGTPASSLLDAEGVVQSNNQGAARAASSGAGRFM